MLTYDHAFSVAFSVCSADPDGEDLTAEDFTQALLHRILDLNANDEWDEAVGAPFDTFEIEE